jgi:hypothetical protein
MKATKPLPPWLQKAKDEGAKEKGKKPSAAHEKGESKRFEAAEDAGAKGKPFANGGKVKKGVQNPATSPKASARSLPKAAGNAKGNVIHLKNGGKA